MNTNPITALRTSLLDVINQAAHLVNEEQCRIIERTDVNTQTKLAIIQELECLARSLSRKAGDVVRRCRQAEGIS